MGIKILKTIYNLKNSSSWGIDGILSYLLNITISYFAEILAYIFNLRIVLSEFKSVLGIAIFKKINKKEEYNKL